MSARASRSRGESKSRIQGPAHPDRSQTGRRNGLYRRLGSAEPTDELTASSAPRKKRWCLDFPDFKSDVNPNTVDHTKDRAITKITRREYSSRAINFSAASISCVAEGVRVVRRANSVTVARIRSLVTRISELGAHPKHSGQRERRTVRDFVCSAGRLDGGSLTLTLVVPGVPEVPRVPEVSGSSRDSSSRLTHVALRRAQGGQRTVKRGRTGSC
jgi:hypothetical protein